MADGATEKSNTKTLVVFGIIAIVLVAGGIFYYWWKNKKAAGSDTKTTTTTNTTTGLSALGQSGGLDWLGGFLGGLGTHKTQQQQPIDYSALNNVSADFGF